MKAQTNPEILLHQAQTLFRQIINAGAERCCAELKMLAEASGHPELQLRQVQALMNLGYHLGTADLSATVDRYAELKVLVDTYGQSEMQVEFIGRDKP